jgi:hypothetical protein
MPQSPTIGTIVAALAKARASFKPVIKDSNNPFFKSKYADLAGVLDSVTPGLSSNGLAIFHTTDNANGALVLTTTLAHESGEWISGTYPIVPVKNDPQGVGAAITYARRYAVSALLSVAAEDDDDGNHASQTGKVASITGEILKKKPTWTPEQIAEAGSITAEIYRAGGEQGEKDVAALRAKMKYDAPTDCIDALGILRNKWQEIENQAKESN